jgi:hypothetical protein
MADGWIVLVTADCEAMGAKSGRSAEIDALDSAAAAGAHESLRRLVSLVCISSPLDLADSVPEVSGKTYTLGKQLACFKIFDTAGLQFPTPAEDGSLQL